MQDKHFNFINCVETFVYNGQQSQWKSCYSKIGIVAMLETGYRNSTYVCNTLQFNMSDSSFSDHYRCR
ncbi:hypothetical protein MKW92_010903 [Papaver armeniacum]|nr:hypothetical protein MKW92_010903 [Papaver armeniacum]